MIFPALIQHMFSDALPAPHWLGLGLSVILLVINARRRDGPALVQRPGDAN